MLKFLEKHTYVIDDELADINIYKDDSSENYIAIVEMDSDCGFDVSIYAGTDFEVMLSSLKRGDFDDSTIKSTKNMLIPAIKILQETYAEMTVPLCFVPISEKHERVYLKILARLGKTWHRDPNYSFRIVLD